MQTRYPSVKTLMQIKDVTEEIAKNVRRVMMAHRYTELMPMLDEPQFKQSKRYVDSCYNRPSTVDIKLNMIDELIRTYGVEYIQRGSNQKSPAIGYCNTGDTYTKTVMYINGLFRVGCWGDIVERGNYE